MKIFSKSFLRQAVSLTILAALFFVLFFSTSTTQAAQPASAWRGRRIYQIMTDRFAYANSANSSSHCQDANSCNMNLYNGGTFQGVIDQLDYITGMGFDAILFSPFIKQLEGKYNGQYVAY